MGRAQIKLDECVSWAVAGGSRPFHWSFALMLDEFYASFFFFECDEILKNRGYLFLSPHESSVIPKTSDQCGWFSPCFAGWVHKLSSYETSLMYRIQELSSSGWMDHGSRTTEIEAFWAAHALSQQEGQSARVLNPLDEMVCIMNRSGSTAIQTDHELVA